MATISRPCDCSRASASPTTCSMMPRSCWPRRSRWRRITANCGATTPAYCSIATSMLRRLPSSTGCWRSTRGTSTTGRCGRQRAARATVGLGDDEFGLRGFTDVLADTDPKSRLAADLHLSIAHSLKTLGRRAESIAEYQQAIDVRPKFGDAYWSLANLKTYTFSAEELAQLEAAVEDPSIAPIDRYHLCFALGKAYEDRKVYELSFRYYERGNALKRAESRYRAELVEQNTTRQKEICTRELFRERDGCGAASREPIFIVGLPRAGSTLLEQILASHSQVEGTQELANVPRAVLDLQGYNPDL